MYSKCANGDPFFPNLRDNVFVALAKKGTSSEAKKIPPLLDSTAAPLLPPEAILPVSIRHFREEGRYTTLFSPQWKEGRRDIPRQQKEIPRTTSHEGKARTDYVQRPAAAKTRYQREIDWIPPRKERWSKSNGSHPKEKYECERHNLSLVSLLRTKRWMDPTPKKIMSGVVGSIA